jgi:hypothetical protein
MKLSITIEQVKEAIAKYINDKGLLNLTITSDHVQLDQVELNVHINLDKETYLSDIPEENIPF